MKVKLSFKFENNFLIFYFIIEIYVKIYIKKNILIIFLNRKITFFRNK